MFCELRHNNTIYFQLLLEFALIAMELDYLKYSSAFTLTLTILILASCISEKGKYDRSEFGYKSYPSYTQIGFYTNEKCEDIDIDHVVSLRDAFDSGAYKWTTSKKEVFANDRFNHVPACSFVNRSKGASLPTDFLRKSQDGKGRDYKIVRFCDYLRKYYAVKEKYNLSLSENNKALLAGCD
jgi:hypothetical protein